MDREFRKDHSPIERDFVPGTLALIICEGLLTPVIQGTGMAFLNMEFNMQGPCYVGDTIHVEVEVLEARKTSKTEAGLVRTRNVIKTIEGRVVGTYTPLRMVKSAQMRDSVLDAYAQRAGA